MRSPVNRSGTGSSVATPKLKQPELDLPLPQLSPTKRANVPPSRASRLEISWSTPKMDGAVPCARGGHSAVLADTNLLVFGGHYFGGHGTFVYLNDLHVLDLERSTWQEILFPEKDAVLPRPRYNHSALLLNGGSRMFVFGGNAGSAPVKDSGSTGALRDMFFFDLQSMLWYQVQWTTDCPAARFGHGCTSVDDVELLIFGGWDGKRSMNDLWAFDSNTFTWRKPVCSGKPPSARQNHAMMPISSDRVLVYGGYTVLPDALPAYNKDIYLLDMETMTWSRPRLVGEYPLGTFSQTLCMQNELAIVLGGWSGTERTPLYMGDKQVRELVNVMAREERLASGQESKSHRKEHTRALKKSSSYAHVLDVTSMEWFTPVQHGEPVANRYGHSCTIIGPHVFIFGGWDGNRALAQLVVGEFQT